MRDFELDQAFLSHRSNDFIPDLGEAEAGVFIPESPEFADDETSALERELQELKEKLEQEKKLAFEEGYKQASAEYEEKLATLTADLNQRFNTIIQDLQMQVEELKKDLEDLAARHAIELAESLMLHAVKYKPEYVTRLIAEALNLQKQTTITAIRVSPEDYDLLNLVNIKKSKPFEGITIFPDETVKAGCLVETVSGEVSLLPFERLDELKENLFM